MNGREIVESRLGAAIEGARHLGLEHTGHDLLSDPVGLILQTRRSSQTESRNTGPVAFSLA